MRKDGAKKNNNLAPHTLNNDLDLLARNEKINFGAFIFSFTEKRKCFIAVVWFQFQQSKIKSTDLSSEQKKEP
jgi:hypothetical protein